MSWVQNAEKNLEEKRLHCTKKFPFPFFYILSPIFPLYIYIFWGFFADNKNGGVEVDVTAIKAFENVVALLNGF